MKEPYVQKGSRRADERYYIKILDDGPYLVYGKPPLALQTIMPDEQGDNWTFAEGQTFKMDTEPVALCRCGASRNKPYCDGAHTTAQWDPAVVAPNEPLLQGADVFDGPVVTLTDNGEYCVFARFCDAKERVWNMVGESDDPQKRDYTIHEANMCPGGRLSAWDNKTGEPYEPHYEPSLGLVEDPALKVSGGLWVRGGIPVQKSDGETYEIRNREMLCRCGMSRNKPWCDGNHASFKFQDRLDGREPEIGSNEQQNINNSIK